MTAGPDADRLIEWWLATAQADAEACIPKAIDYSSSDLLAIGTSLIPPTSDQRRIEAAIGFYAHGKSARIVGAYVDGRDASDDSWHDLSVYSMMGRYTRRYGQWP